MALLDRIRSTKRDYSKYLFHFTKPQPVWDNPNDFIGRRRIGTTSAFDILKGTLTDGHLRGRAVLANEVCVCFSETSLEEILWLMSLPEWDHNRYTYYGVCVPKDWAYRYGGRPVIYQHADERPHLNASNMFRHNRFEPTGDIDFSWEREWRVKIDVLNLDPEITTAVCLKPSEAHEIMRTPLGNNTWKATSVELLVR
ncbi:MAG: hypothetical protein AB7H97_10465 [Pseudobdellovibrionaceae bacterium]